MWPFKKTMMKFEREIELLAKQKEISLRRRDASTRKVAHMLDCMADTASGALNKLEMRAKKNDGAV